MGQLELMRVDERLGVACFRMLFYGAGRRASAAARESPVAPKQPHASAMSKTTTCRNQPPTRGWSLDFILNTHHHNDHVGGNLELKRAFSGLQVGCFFPDCSCGPLALYLTASTGLRLRRRLDSLSLILC